MSNIVVVALYKFVTLEDFQSLREPLLDTMNQHGVRGTLLLALEGINGTVAGTREGTSALLEWLRRDPRLADLDWKESFCDEMPFYRTKVKLKKEIVTMGIPGISPNERVGTYVEPRDWNDLISDPEVLLIDTRNDYEVSIGTFEGAIDPQTRTFREFPEYVRQEFDPQKHKKVAMFCTGGIRCEKASSYMLSQGFEEVFHLKGGILKYLETVPEQKSRWNGECFVFDERVAVGHGLKVGEAQLCRACRQPLTPADRARPEFVEGVQCHHCVDSLDEAKRQAAAERQRQIALAKARGEAHLGEDAKAAAERRRLAAKARREADRKRNRSILV